MRTHKMLMLLILFFSAAIIFSRQGLPEEYDQAPVEKAGLFKNNLAFVTRSLKIPAGAKTFYIKGNPAPIHGTMWASFAGSVTFDFKEVTVTKEESTPVKLDIQTLLNQCGNKTVKLHLNNDEVISGQLLTGSPPLHGYIFVKTKKGRELIQISRIWRFTFADKEFVIKSKYLLKKNTLKEKFYKITVLPAKKARVLTFSYLTRGAIWAPSYRLDLTSRNQGDLAMKAVIKNELDDFLNVDIFLISGFPAIFFAQARSLANNKIQTFINQLNSGSQGNYRSSAITQQVMLNVYQSSSSPDLSNTKLTRDTDLYFHPAGRHSISKGNARLIFLATDKVKYERVVEWHISNRRDEHGRLLREWRNQSGKKSDQEAWDSIKIRNPFSFPLTTAPVTVYQKGRLISQNICYWTPPGEESNITFTKALNIKTQHQERELKGSRKRVMIGDDDFRESIVAGEITVRNLRRTSQKVFIYRTFFGKHNYSEGNPKLELLPEGVGSLNEKSKLTWELNLEPGQKITLKYRFKVLTDI